MLPATNHISGQNFVKSKPPSPHPTMPFLLWLILSLDILHLSNASKRQSLTSFIHQYKDAIQDFTMTGHESGWSHCDILSDGFLIQGIPHVSMELDKIEDLDTKWVLGSSHCLLVAYHVNNQAGLHSLLEIGRTIFQHKRMALVITLASGLKFEIGANSTKLPFLVAAEWESQKTQFICPIVGETKSHQQSKMCVSSHASYENRTLQMGIIGAEPYLVRTETGKDGIDIRMMDMLAKKLRFRTNLIDAPSFFASPNMVCMRPRLLKLLCA